MKSLFLIFLVLLVGCTSLELEDGPLTLFPEPSSSYVEPSEGFEVSLSVDYDKELRERNELLIGDQVQWGWSNEGLDVNKNTIDDFYAMSKYPREARMNILRFPEGLPADAYQWKKHIGDDRESHNLQGIPDGWVSPSLIGTDEFMEFKGDAEAIIVINFGTGSKEDAADWVEYLNSEVGENPNGGKDWALERANNGHSEPYNVKYFEIGNEIYVGHDWLTKGGRRDVRYGHVGGEDYAAGYKEFYDAMKEVDSSISIGAIGLGSRSTSKRDIELGNDDVLWNEEILKVMEPDFWIYHDYAFGPEQRYLSESGTYDDHKDEIAEIGLGYVYRQLDGFELIHDDIGDDAVIAITEHGSPFSEGFLSGLIMGSFMIEMHKRDDVLLAPSFNLFERDEHDKSGMIFGHIAVNQDNVLRSVPYPLYYTLGAFGRYTGDIILDEDVVVDTYDAESFRDLEARSGIPKVSVLASKSSGKLYLAILNRDLEESASVSVNLEGFDVGSGKIYQLYNEDVFASNEFSSETSLEAYLLDVSGSSFEVVVPRHSFSVLELS